MGRGPWAWSRVCRRSVLEPSALAGQTGGAAGRDCFGERSVAACRSERGRPRPMCRGSLASSRSENEEKPN